MNFAYNTILFMVVNFKSLIFKKSPQRILQIFFITKRKQFFHSGSQNQNSEKFFTFTLFKLWLKFEKLAPLCHRPTALCIYRGPGPIGHAHATASKGFYFQKFFPNFFFLVGGCEDGLGRGSQTISKQNVVSRCLYSIYAKSFFKLNNLNVVKVRMNINREIYYSFVRSSA